MGSRFALVCITTAVYQGLHVQTVLDAGYYGSVRKEHYHDHQNFGEIYAGKLRCSGLRNPNRVDIFATYDEKRGICVCRSTEASSEEKIIHASSSENRTLPSIIGTLSSMLVKKSVLGLQNLVTPADENFLSSLCAITELIRAMKGER